MHSFSCFWCFESSSNTFFCLRFSFFWCFDPFHNLIRLHVVVSILPKKLTFPFPFCLNCLMLKSKIYFYIISIVIIILLYDSILIKLHYRPQVIALSFLFKNLVHQNNVRNFLKHQAGKQYFIPYINSLYIHMWVLESN